MDELVTWLRRRIEERLFLALHTIKLGSNAEWNEQSSGVLVTGPGTDADCWDGTWAMGDSSLTRLMEANDPRDTIDRCVAELAILDGYEARNEDADLMLGPAVLHQREWSGLRLAVRLLATGYRHRPGYQEEWAPESATPSR